MEDPPIPAKPVVKPPPPAELHDRPFRPTNPPRKGKSIGKFPEWLKSPPEEKKPAKKEEEEERPGFKCTYRGLSIPMPSIATNYRNLKASYPSAFSSPSRF